MWQVDKNKKEPFYRQIINHIIQEIESGNLLAGDKLSPERKLARDYNVNRSTIVHALDELVSLGWITRRQGSGTEVASGPLLNRQTPKANWQQLWTSPFLKEDPYIQKLKEIQSNSDCIDLYTGELPKEIIPDFQFPAISWDKVMQEKEKRDITGYIPLKKVISKNLENTLHIDMSIQDLLITSGSTQGISLLMRTLLESGDMLATEDPSFLANLPLFASLGIRLIEIPQDNEGIIPEELERILISRKIKLLYLNPSYQNPTGLTMPLSRRKEIIEICSKYQVPIIEDDVFSELAFHKNPTTLKELSPQTVIYLGSLSKIFGSTIKIGWLLAPKNIIHNLASAKKRMDSQTEIFPQLLATTALTQPDYQSKQKKLLSQLTKKSTAFEKEANMVSNDWKFQSIEGGLYYWMTYLGKPLKIKDWELFLQEKVLIAPSFLFSSNCQSFRLNYTRLTENNIQEFFKALERITDKLKSRR